MPKKVTRVVIDTNLWISFLISKDFKKLDKLIFAKSCVFVFSQELLDEFIEVATRSKFKPFFTSKDIEDLLNTIDSYADFVIVKTNIKACRDPKDNFLLSLSIDGNVDFLITGDKDLLALAKFEKTKIITIIDFILANT